MIATFATTAPAGQLASWRPLELMLGAFALVVGALLLRGRSRDHPIPAAPLTPPGLPRAVVGPPPGSARLRRGQPLPARRPVARALRHRRHHVEPDAPAHDLRGVAQRDGGVAGAGRGRRATPRLAVGP